MNRGRDLASLHDAYRAVFDGKNGDIVLKHLCKIGFVFDTSYCNGDTHETAHREGQRRLVLSILRFVNKSPEEIFNMVNEENRNV